MIDGIHAKRGGLFWQVRYQRNEFVIVLFACGPSAAVEFGLSVGCFTLVQIRRITNR
jgi:hypothetical protein